MSTGTKWISFGSALLLGAAILCTVGVNTAWANAAPQNQKIHKKSKKKEELPPPPLPSGPTGPVQQIPLDSIAAVPPQVTFENNQLTINAPNSTLADILRAVRKLTGAEIEVPSAPERVVTHLGPGPAREVVAELLNGSRFNYVLLGSPENPAALTRVVLVAKTTAPQDAATPSPDQSMGQQAINQPQQPEATQDGAEAESSDDNSADDNSDQTPAEDQQPQEQNGIKTPQQMLQEMQQRQMQMQQQQQQGQPPLPQGRPPGAPQQD